jgi:hypothetical protein
LLCELIAPGWKVYAHRIAKGEEFLRRESHHPQAIVLAFIFSKRPLRVFKTPKEKIAGGDGNYYSLSIKYIVEKQMPCVGMALILNRLITH